MTKKGLFCKFKGSPIGSDELLSSLEKQYGAIEKDECVINKNRGYVLIYFENQDVLADILSNGVVTVDGSSLKVEPIKEKNGTKNGQNIKNKNNSGNQKKNTDGKKKNGNKSKTENESKKNDKTKKPKNNEKAIDGLSVFIGKIPKDFDENKLKETFSSKFGSVKSITRKKRKNGTLAAVITFEKKTSVENALKATEGEDAKAGVLFQDNLLVLSQFKNPKKQPQPQQQQNTNGENGKKKNKKKKTKTEGENKKSTKASQPEKKTLQPHKTVYVSNLGTSTTEEQIKTVLEPYGKIKNINFKKRECVGSVEFSTVEEMEAASKAEIVYEEQNIAVGPWKSAKEDDKIKSLLHVTGFGSIRPTEDGLKEVLKQFGTINLITLRPTRCFALVEFEEEEGALAAVEAAKTKDFGLPPFTDDGVVIEMSEIKRKNPRKLIKKSPPPSNDSAPEVTPSPTAEKSNEDE